MSDPGACAPPGVDTRTAVLAFDYGAKRVGVAVGDIGIGIAHPLTTVDAEDAATRFGAIGALISEWQPARLVVGLPLNEDGTDHDTTRLVRKFANRLHGRFGLPVAFVDERLTSHAAGERLREQGYDARRAKAHLDVAAAQEILQNYLDLLPKTGTPAA